MKFKNQSPPIWIQIPPYRFLKTLLIICCLFTSSCSKEEEKPQRDGFLTLNMNGEPKSFNYFVSANDPPRDQTIHFVTILGQGSSDLTDWFSFQLVSPTHIEVGTYHDSSSELHADFQDFSSTQEGGSFTLSIEEMDYYGVKGSFSGVLNKISGESITITDGKFEAYYNYRRYD